MGLLFVGGVMNLLWIAAIAAFVLVEKVLPAGVRAGRASGFLLVAAGMFFVLQAGYFVLGPAQAEKRRRPCWSRRHDMGPN
jgi:hypothetical protein